MRGALKRTVAMALNTRPDEQEARFAAADFVYREFSGEDFPRNELTELAQRAKGRQFSARSVLHPLSGEIPSKAKELFVKAAVLTALTNERLTDEAKALVLQVAEALDLTRAHLRGIIEELFSDRGPAPKILPD